MPLGTEVDLGPGDIVLDGDPAPPNGGRLSPLREFWPMYRGQTAAWIKMPLGTGVGIGTGHIVLHGNPARHSKKEHNSPQIFGPYLLWPNGWMNQDAAWYGGRPRLWSHRVRWAPTCPKGHRPTPIFGPCMLWPNGWMDQDATWYGGRSRPRPHYVR